MKTEKHYEIQWRDGQKWTSEGIEITKQQAKDAIRTLKNYKSLANKTFRLVRVTTTREVLP